MKKKYFWIKAMNWYAWISSDESFFKVIAILFHLAPRGLYASTPSDSSIKICWSHPKYGSVQGYNITYQRIAHNDSILGMMMFKDQVWSIKIASTLRSLCYVIEDLQPWVDYNFSIFAWNQNETGFVSQSQTVTTRPDCEFFF